MISLPNLEIKVSLMTLTWYYGKGQETCTGNKKGQGTFSCSAIIWIVTNLYGAYEAATTISKNIWGIKTFGKLLEVKREGSQT